MQKEVLQSNKKKAPNKIKKIATDTSLKIETLLTGFSENKPDVNAKRFFHTVKYCFREFFNVHYEYTYEELVEKLNNIDEKISSISSAIKDLKIRIDDTFIDEKNNPRLKDKIDELEGKMLKEHQLEKFYTQLKAILIHENLKEQIQELVQNISTLEYGNEIITNDELIGLINTFKLILEKIISFEEIEQKKHKQRFFVQILNFLGLKHQNNSKPKIEEPELVIKPKEELDISKPLEIKKVESQPSELEKHEPQVEAKKKVLEPKKDSVQNIKTDVLGVTSQKPSKNIMEVINIIEKAKENTNERKISVAKKKYLKALSLYKKLTLEEKELVYRELLKLYHALINYDIASKKSK